jgi:isoprenylcysteine carboxyl methyltransferase (ICMT) family protein YpbQ
MWRPALFFTVGNALILLVRIGDEERALGPEWRKAFDRKGRFLP